MRSRASYFWVLAAAALLAGSWWMFGANATAHAQQEPSPTPGSGETVYAPKKAKQPPPQPEPSEQPVTQPATQPGEETPPKPAPTEKPEKINPNQVYTLSTESNLVNVNVLVTDNDGNPIGGLDKKNFKVMDDGVQQNVTNFSTAEAPMTICMLIEFSNKWWPYLYLALEDSYQFLNFIQPQDWTAVIDFDLKPQILQDFTHDRYQVKGALDSMRIPGFSETNLYDALSFTLDRMKDIQGRKAILLVCTGYDTFSKLTYGEMLKIVKGSNTPVYPISILEFLTVRYGDNIESLQARNALTTFAKYSGGEAYFPRFEGEMPQIYQQVADQLRREYSLGYIPTNNSKNGKYHKLEVQLVDAQGNPLTITNQKGKKLKYRVVSRDGYYAPKA